MSVSEIAIPLDLSTGIFTNTIYKNGKLQLVELQTADNGKIAYVTNGTWESESIRIADKIKAFEKVVKNIVTSGTNTSHKIYTKSSTDAIDWTPYTEVTADGTIQSPTNTYIQVKIEITSTPSENLSFTVDEFNDNRYNNQYLNTSNGYLEAKRNYTLNYDIDSSWLEDGHLYRMKLDKSIWQKIDSLSSVQG